VAADRSGGVIVKPLQAGGRELICVAGSIWRGYSQAASSGRSGIDLRGCKVMIGEGVI
jgi:hypothetical protein